MVFLLVLVGISWDLLEIVGDLKGIRLSGAFELSLLEKKKTQLLLIIMIGGFDCRYITSDCDAVATVFEDQRYAKSPEDAVADVLNAGMVVYQC